MLAHIGPSRLPTEQFLADLHSICGQFGVRPAEGRSIVRGHLQLVHNAGVEVAHVAADLLQISRDARAIRRDAGENYFLILQEEGQALMSQNDRSCLMQPGDMVLIDSACPSEFTFFGQYNRQLSLHLPRAEMHARFNYDLIRGGMSLSRQDPTVVALCAVLAKALEPSVGNEASASYLREAMFGLIGAILHERSGRDNFAGIAGEIGEARALSAGRAYLDAHYRNPDLSVQDMADDLSIPLRQMQRAFAAMGTTPTNYLLVKRLEHAKRAIEDRRAGRRGGLISSIAYEAGFSDLSYFNRCYRRAFGSSPTTSLV